MGWIYEVLPSQGLLNLPMEKEKMFNSPKWYIFKIRFKFIKKLLKIWKNPSMSQGQDRKLNCPDKEYTGCLNIFISGFIYI